MGGDEILGVEAPHDNAEEYLEGLAMLEQDGNRLPTVSQVAAMLRVKPPSAVQMLRRLAERGHVKYLPLKGVRLKAKGRRIGMRMVRNGRLMEVFITQTLKLPLDVRLAHSVEHDMTVSFADALCSLTGHPQQCPHEYPIPPGACCPTNRPSPAG